MSGTWYQTTTEGPRLVAGLRYGRFGVCRGKGGWQVDHVTSGLRACRGKELAEAIALAEAFDAEVGDPVVTVAKVLGRVSI